MKNVLLLFLSFWSCLLIGQERPLVVDNSKYFPPPKGYQMAHDYSTTNLVYNLKSSIWNKEYDRNPQLKENQFSTSFVLSQVVNPQWRISFDIMNNFEFLKEQGCVSASEFAVNDQWHRITPNYLIREDALSYKSKKLTKIEFDFSDESQMVSEMIASLKDSLIAGKNFITNIKVFDHYQVMSRKDSLYNYYEDLWVPWGQNRNVTVVGYNDTIKTATGRGAFKAIDSSQPVNIFYYDYKWLDHISVHYFLQEDFNYSPQLAVHVSLSKSIHNLHPNPRHYLFTDTLIIDELGRKIDYYDNQDYFAYKGIANVIEVNGEKLPKRSKKLFLPDNSADGHYELLSDVSDLVKASDFESMKIMVYDPVYSRYTDEEGNEIHYFEKETEAEVKSSYLSFIGSDKKIVGEVERLSDTTLNFHNFHSGLIKDHLGSPSFVKSHEVKLRRIVISFNKANAIDDNPPYFIKEPERANVTWLDSTFNFDFKATDLDGDNLEYYLSSGNPLAQVDANSGLFSFEPEQAGEYFFTIGVTDGLFHAFSTAFVTVVDGVPELPYFSRLPQAEDLTINVGEWFFFQIYIMDPDRGSTMPQILVKSTTAPSTDVYVNPLGWVLSFYGETEGVYDFEIMGVSQGDTIYHSFKVKVNLLTSGSEIHSLQDGIQSFYPNPSRDFVTFDLSLLKGRKLTLEVFDITGKMKDQVVYSNLIEGINTIKYNIDPLSVGTYLFRFRHEDGYFETVRIIKNSR